MIIYNNGGIIRRYFFLPKNMPILRSKRVLYMG